MSGEVLLTGGHGFLGHWVRKELERRGVNHTTPTRRHLDLMDPYGTWDYLREHRPEAVIHMAAKCGGIGANQEKPAEFFYENLMMGCRLMHMAWQAGVKKFVGIGTVCSYPKHTPVPFMEIHFWSGYPEETNAFYGLAKKMLLVQGQAYRKQYGFNAIHLLPANLYGPGDNFDLRTSHVIPAIIRKIWEAKKAGRDFVKLWGSGDPTREFLYIEDAAKGICDALEFYDEPEPLNLGTCKDISIRGLAAQIAGIMGFEGDIEWDLSKADGQPARCLDTTKSYVKMGWKPQISLGEGLRRTIEWWMAEADVQKH